VFAQRRRRQSRGHGQHFAHAGPAARPFVANHDRIARLDLRTLYRLERQLFRFKNPRWTAMLAPGLTNQLHHTSLRRKIAAQNR
jgi:hypothetical protein